MCSGFSEETVLLYEEKAHRWGEKGGDLEKNGVLRDHDKIVFPI